MKTWKAVLDHLGSGITEDRWMIEHGISGRQYLEQWIASILQRPTAKLPYLILLGLVPNTGISTFHEALSLILPVRRLDYALEQSFNEEMENVLVGVLEGGNSSKRLKFLAKLDDWVTMPAITLHRKCREPKTITNKIHWVECTNDPIIPTLYKFQTTVVCLEERPKEVIRKDELHRRLRQEAGDFIGYMIQLPLIDFLRSV